VNPAIFVFLLACRANTLAQHEPPPSPTNPVEADRLLPLASYDAEMLGGARVLWHPAFREDVALRAEVSAALDADLRAYAQTARPASVARLSEVRVAVAPSSPAMAALPSGGRGLGYHRSASWLGAHGLDGAREGVIEIYNARDFLAKRVAEPGVTARMIDGVLALALPSRAPPKRREDGLRIAPLREYRVEELAGLQVLWHPDVPVGSDIEDRVRSALREDLATIARVAPHEAVASLAGTRIAVDVEAYDVDGERLHRVATHRSARWLVAHGLDAEREGVIEIYEPTAYLDYRENAQPMVLLHELTHVLEHRADPARLGALDAAYEDAVLSGRYEQVRHVEAAPGQLQRAYALNNAAEYGAELAEAFFGRNDFYPFERAELIRFDPAGCAAAALLWSATCAAPDATGEGGR
jgi:hypothetical protein